MKIQTLKLFKYPIHPVVFSTYPILALYIRNIFLVPFIEFFLILGINTILMILLWWGLNKIIKSINKSAFILSAFYILFFSFGHFLPALSNFLQVYLGLNIQPHLAGQMTLWNWVLISIWFAFLLTLIVLAFKSSSKFHFVTSLLNVISLTLAFFVTIQSTQISIQFRKLVTEENIISTITTKDLSPGLTTRNSTSDHKLPNIYYIILDGYGSSNILEKYYDFDNHEMIEFLLNNGFYVSEESHSNYAHTVLSLASSLNFDYLDTLTTVIGTSSNNPVPVVKLIKSNRVSNFLNNLGYQTIAFESGYGATELPASDQYYTHAASITPFINELINLTPFRILLTGYQYGIHRERILSTFEQLPQTAKGQPALVFAHILSPHPPFAFGSNGELDHPDIGYSTLDGNYLTDVIGRDDYKVRYRNQVDYLNKKLKETITTIISENGKKSIIIIQGDHGPGSMLDWDNMENSNVEERMSILNAYYFPDQNYENLYSNMTPVNTFRIIFNQYFDMNLETIEDKKFFSIMKTPYDVIDISEELRLD